MSKSLEKIRDIKSLINEFYQDELNEGARKSWLVFQQYCDDIKQDLELLEQLKQQRDSLAINNGELCVKVCNLEKENQELVVNKNLAQKLALNFKKAIEIIKNKCVSNTNLWLVVCSRNYEDYKSFVENKDHELVRIEHNILTQQEYELLKEVLE